MAVSTPPSPCKLPRSLGGPVTQVTLPENLGGREDQEVSEKRTHSRMGKPYDLATSIACSCKLPRKWRPNGPGAHASESVSSVSTTAAATASP